MKNLIFICLLGFLLTAGIFFDREIVQWVVELRIDALNEFMIWVSYSGTLFVVLIVMTSLFLWNEKKRKWIPPLWLSLGAGLAVSSLLKILFMRERPFLALEMPLLVEKGGGSFPSGHVTAVFSTLGVLDKEFPRLKWFWFGFAILVAFSRIYLGVHYLSDVVIGAVIGLSAGFLIVNFWETKYHILKNDQ